MLRSPGRKKNMNREQLISPDVLRLVSYAAAAGRLLALVIPVLCLAEPLAWYAGFPPASVLFGYISDALCLILLALISILCPWCHEVLVAKRGSPITRFLSLLIGFFGLLLLLNSLYAGMTGCDLSPDPELVALGLSIGLSFTLLININNIAAAPLWMRICLPLACICYIGCAFTIGIIPLLLPFTLAKLLAALLLAKPLALLHRNAPRIASLPESD